MREIGRKDELFVSFYSRYHILEKEIDCLHALSFLFLLITFDTIFRYG